MQFNEAKKILESHQTDISNLGVYSLAIFGSIAKNKGKKKSDIDILIEFDSKQGLFGFVDVKDYLESILHRKMDLVTKGALHHALEENILREARQIF